MKKEREKYFYWAMGSLLAFAIWTALLCLVDVKAIGPNGGAVGFSSFNRYVHSLTGVNMALYALTDWLGLVPVAVALCFAATGLWQWIRRKSILKVDYDIIALGVFYVLVAGVYLLFEVFPVNHRPVLIEGRLETSYPSSTTVLVICFMITALMQLKKRMRARVLRRTGEALILMFVAFMLIGRLLSGVHWVTDIIGGALVSAGLTLLYAWAEEVDLPN